jgi:UDP-N-acetylglucosamine--N-acetylmuramyl-(pentapeptide) pyrophosphoryl-undecaprenol N-acetylglucosamine transferase
MLAGEASGGQAERFDPATLELLWVGGEGGMEADLVKRAGLPFESIPAAGVHGVGWRALPGNLARLGRGTLQARQLLKRFHPQAVFFTGGYVGVPVAVAGWRTPSLVYVPDIEPGLALKAQARSARCIAVTTPDSRAFFPGKRVVVTGYPTRPELRRWQRDRAQEFLSLEKDLPTLLVTGGSQGARSINRALLAALPELLPEMQVVHLSGKLDWAEVEAARQSLDAALAGRYHAYPYLHEMGAALASADLVVARAGASCLGEFPLFGIPALLAPYPYAWRYQKVNADYLATRGAALVVNDEELPGKLAPLVRSILGDPARRSAMRQAMLNLAQPAAAAKIGGLLLELAGGS